MHPNNICNALDTDMTDTIHPISHSQKSYGPYNTPFTKLLRLLHNLSHKTVTAHATTLSQTSVTLPKSLSQNCYYPSIVPLPKPLRHMHHPSHKTATTHP